MNFWSVKALAPGSPGKPFKEAIHPSVPTKPPFSAEVYADIPLTPSK
jgi:hypothetical protein